MNEPKIIKNQEAIYAISIHLKYGEVLHLEDIDAETKNTYLDLCRNPSKSILIENNNSIRNLFGTDIAKISVVAYDEKYRTVWHPVKKMFLSESTLGRRTFSTIIKIFIFMMFMAVIGILSSKVIDGTIMDVIFDPKLFAQTFGEALDIIQSVFSYTFVALIILNIVDVLLGVKAQYNVNQDGSIPVENSALNNIELTVIFAIVYFIAKIILSGIINFG